MEFIEFKQQLKVVESKVGNDIRLRYIEKFVNDMHPRYQEQIVQRHKFQDGYCYLGYLWDYMKEPTVIDRKYIEARVNSIGEVMVFWDIHSSEKILIKDYWKFDKDAVLKLNYQTLLAGEIFLPEDIYIFDDSFLWTIVQTHEELNGKRYCLKSGII